MTREEIINRIEEIGHSIEQTKERIARRNTQEAIAICEGFRKDLESVRAGYRLIDLASEHGLISIAKLQGKENYILDIINGFSEPATHKETLESERNELMRELQKRKQQAIR